MNKIIQRPFIIESCAQSMRNLIAITFLLLPFFSFGNRIDDLKTEAEIKEFVEEIVGPNFSFPKGFAGDTFLIEKYIKADLNNDGLTDLVVNSRQIFVILDLKEKGFRVSYIGHDLYEYRLLKLFELPIGPAMLVKRQSGFGRGWAPLFLRAPDTLVYFQGDFIEYWEWDNADKIDSFTISLSCWKCQPYSLDVNKNMSLKLHGQPINISSPHDRAIVDSMMVEIFQLLNHISIRTMPSSFTTEATDQPQVELTCFYNGNRKALSDYGMEGSLALIHFYRKIDALIKVLRKK